MSCRICGRNSCTESFHPIQEQEEHEKEENTFINLEYVKKIEGQRDALLNACNSYAEVFDDDTCKILEAAKGDKYMVWLQGIITEIEAAIALAEKERHEKT